MTNRRIGLAALLAASILSATTALQARPRGEFAELYKDLPFQMGMVSRPSIPCRSVSIVDFGGVGDGISMNTEAFAKAIDHLSSKGGGHLVVPAGIWRTGPVELKSNIDLHIEHEAIVIFDPDKSLYPIIRTSFEGLDTRRCESPLHADGAHDVSITGGGVIDGSGEYWRPLKKNKVTASQWKEKVASGGVLNDKKDYWYPDADYIEVEKTANMNVPDESYPDEKVKSFLRPVMVSLRNCRNVLLEDCTFQNSPAWNIHPLICSNVIIKNITVRNPSYAQNGDGIDIDSCTDVVLVDSSFDVGDDGICIKSGKDKDGRDRGIPTKGLIVSGCTVYHGHGGFVVGSEMSGGVRDVKVSDCRFLGTDVGLRFKSKRGRGGVVENIWIDNIYMTNIVTETLLFDLHYGGKSAVEALADGDGGKKVEMMPVDETTPAFRDIHISNVVCNGAGRAMYFNGLPEMPVKGIHITNCTIHADKPIEINYAEDVEMTGVKVFTTQPLSRLTVLSEMKRSPKPTELDERKGAYKWNYTTGLELKAMLDMYQAHGDERVFRYAESWYDGIIAEDGTISTYKKSNFSTDHVCPARTLFYLYEKTGKEKYRKAMDIVYDQIKDQPRTPEGGFWHKKIYPNQMWLDGLYMAEPFYAQYAREFLSPEERISAYEDIYNQFLTVAQHTFDPQTLLYRHAWDSSHESDWCEKTTGQSQHAWGRALGWYCMAIVDVLEIIPQDACPQKRQQVTDILQGIFSTLPEFADPKSGMWFQVLDRPGQEGNYVESTCAAMFSYAMLKGTRLGYLPSVSREQAEETYNNFLKTFVDVDAEGIVTLRQCCAVAGLGGAQKRAGDYQYYINEKICENDPKGIGPLIWAALEIER